MKRFLLFLIVIILLGVVAFWINDNFLSDQTPKTEETEKKQEKTSLQILLENEETKITLLVAVNESNATGRAYLLKKEGGSLQHAVVATLEEPTQGSVYEGWLVDPESSEFFSTGLMQKDEIGMWVLEYETDKKFPTYTRVVITEETEIDDTPETHILEGDF